jgi:hypothetical protein
MNGALAPTVPRKFRLRSRRTFSPGRRAAIIAAIAALPRSAGLEHLHGDATAGGGAVLDDVLGAGQVAVGEGAVQRLEQRRVTSADADIEDDALDHQGDADEAETDEQPQDPLRTDGCELEEFV